MRYFKTFNTSGGEHVVDIGFTGAGGVEPFRHNRFQLSVSSYQFIAPLYSGILFREGQSERGATDLSKFSARLLP